MSTETAAFALRTHDAKWIARNHATPGPDGTVIVQVPLAEVEAVTGHPIPVLRHTFAAPPANSPRSWLCPAEWVPETAALVAARKAA